VRAAPSVDGVVLVVPPERVGDEEPGVDVVVAGGATRSASVRAGLRAVPTDADIVVVHDAARPLAEAEHVEIVIDAVHEQHADAAVLAVPVHDTVKRVSGELVTETIDRSDLVAVQTPQAFRAEALRRAHDRGADATDDAGLVESAGGCVVVVAGDPGNLKITTQRELDMARAIVGRR